MENPKNAFKQFVTYLVKNRAFAPDVIALSGITWTIKRDTLGLPVGSTYAGDDVLADAITEHAMQKFGGLKVA